MFNVVIESSQIKIQIILIQTVVIRYKIIIIKQESKYKEYSRCIIACGHAMSYFIRSSKKEPKYGKMCKILFICLKKSEDLNQPQ